MSKRRKDAVWVAILSVLSTLAVWHAFHWHSLGMHREMLGWIGTERAHVLVLYNLGLMLWLGLTLGLLMKGLTDLVGYQVREMKHFDDEDSRDSEHAGRS